MYIFPVQQVLHNVKVINWQSDSIFSYFYRKLYLEFFYATCFELTAKIPFFNSKRAPTGSYLFEIFFKMSQRFSNYLCDISRKNALGFAGSYIYNVPVIVITSFSVVTSFEINVSGIEISS